MTNWKEYRLGEIAKVKGGKRLPKGGNLTTFPNAHPYIRVRDMGSRHLPIENLEYVPDDVFPSIKNYIVDSGDVILSIVGSVGLVSMVNENLDKASLTENCVKIIPEKKFLRNEFLYYFLKSEIGQDEIYKKIVGAVQPKLPIYNINSISMAVPDLSTQTAIAEILSSLDDKIELNNQINQELEELGQALFDNYFFDKSDSTWHKVNLGDVIEIKGGFSYKGKHIGSGNSLLLGMGCVSYSQRFLKEGARQYSGDCNSTYFIEPGEIIIATRQQSDNLPILGQPAIIPQTLSHKKAIVGTNLYRVFNHSKMRNNTLFQLLRSERYKKFIKENSKGTTVRMITKDAVESFKFKIPPDDLLEQINKVIDPISNLIEQNIIENEGVSNLRDLLLTKLISGELEVSKVLAEDEM